MRPPHSWVCSLWAQSFQVGELKPRQAQDKKLLRMVRR